VESTKTILEHEAELIEGFLSRVRWAELAFIDYFRPILRNEVRIHWTALWRHIDDFEQAALVKLCELRETEEGRKTIRQPLAKLAKMLIEGPARKLRREPKHLSLKVLKKGGEPAQRPGQEASYERELLLEIAARLPAGMATTIQCQQAFALGEGPELHIALGVDKESAHKRLLRAQEAIQRIANGEEIEVEDE